MSRTRSCNRNWGEGVKSRYTETPWPKYDRIKVNFNERPSPDYFAGTDGNMFKSVWKMVIIKYAEINMCDGIKAPEFYSLL